MKYLILFILLTLPISAQDRLNMFGRIGKARTTDIEFNLYEDITQDYKNFYSKKTFDNSFFWLTVGSLLANTKADHNFQHWYQDSVRSEKTDEWSMEFKHFGMGTETLPILFGTALIGHGLKNWGLDGEGYIYDWSSKSLRAIFVGAPVLFVSQRLTGGGSPKDGDDSTWRPFNDSHGVSGHSFMGAVPFLTAAHMTDDKLLKGAYYLGSTLCAWSRVNDDDHYLSQALLGWSLAYVSTLAVFDKESSIILAPIIDGKRFGITFSITF